MDEETIVPGESLSDIMLDQLNMMLVFIARPVVQRQIIAIAVILLVALLVPEGLRWWWQRQKLGNSSKTQMPRWQQWTTRLYALYAPLAGLILANAVIWFFERQGYPNGLLISSRGLFWVWLAYRALLMVLYARYGTAIKPYHYWALTPIFFLTLLWTLFGRQVGLIGQLSAVPLIQFSNLTFTLGNFLNAAVVLYIFLVGAWIIERVINRNLQSRLDAEPGLVQSIATLSRYAVSGLGIIVSLGALGLDAGSLALVAGGLSVGIGIGLQEIVANFVSGLTLLFEQSLRPGDIIELDGHVSEVERVSLRTTTVNTMDNIKLIIPNATFTTKPVTTLTKGDHVVRFLLPLRVAYDVDPKQVRQIIEETAAKQPQILDNPAPLLFFRGVGNDSSLDLELAVWTDRPKFRGLIKSELYYLLFAALAENGIEIPIPKRDLMLHQGHEKV